MPKSRCILTVILAVGLAIAAGCESQPKAQLGTSEISLGDTFDETALTFGTARLLAQTYVDMVTVSAEAASHTENPSVREGAIRWRIVTAGRLDRIQSMPDPRLRFAALWTLAVQMRVDFYEGEDATRFGDQQYRFQDFASRLESDAVELAYRAFPDPVIEHVRPEIDHFGRTVGVSGWFTPEITKTSRGAISQLVSVPLSPISGLQGVGNTPAAINRFTDAAREMTRVVENIPERTRWQIELMLLEAEHQGALAAAIKEVRDTRRAFQDATTRLPGQIQELLEDPNLAQQLERIGQVIVAAREASEAISETLREFRSAVGDVRQTLVDAQAASAAVQKAAEEVRLTTEVIKKDDEAAGPAEEPKEPFRVSDVTEAAARIEAAAAEVRGVIADARAEGEIPALVTGARQAETVIRLITVYAAILIGIAFVAGLALMVTWRLMHRRRAA